MSQKKSYEEIEAENAALISRMKIMTEQNDQQRNEILNQIGVLCEALERYIPKKLVNEVKWADNIELVDLPEPIDEGAVNELNDAGEYLLEELDSLERTHGRFRGQLRIAMDRLRNAVGIEI